MQLTQSENKPETIIRFTLPWWSYMLARGGILRAIVNGIEDSLAITGRTLLLVFLVYCGAKAGALLVAPKTDFPIWLEMGMFILQLAGLEGSIPGLARQADTFYKNNNEAGAKKIEKVMTQARAMTVLSITEGALYALHVDAQWLQAISAVLLIIRGFVITGFLIEQARIDNKAPRVLSKDEHARELETEKLTGEQAQIIKDLRTQITESQALLATAQQGKQQYEDEQKEIIQRLQDQIAVLEKTHSVAVTGSETQMQVLSTLQNRLQVAEQETATLTAKWEQKCREAETANTALQSAKLQITDLQNAVSQPASADLQPAKVQSAPSARPQTAKLQNADRETAKISSANAGSQPALSAKSSASQTANAVAPNITSLEQERAKRPQKLAHAEVLAYIAAHPNTRRADVAVELGISERKVYDALAWQKEQDELAATGTN